LPDIESVPGEEAFDDDVSPAKWRIPDTPIRIVRPIKERARGSFCLSESTVMAGVAFLPEY
jgi:hypothetical protein